MARICNVGSSITISSNGKSKTWSLSGFPESTTKDEAKQVAEVVNAMKFANSIRNYSLGEKQTWVYVS